MENEKLERYLNWVNLEIDNRDIYHNHKEKMAWTATVAYFAIIPLTLYASRNIEYSLNFLPMTFRIAFAFGILVFAISALVFINMQFERRWVAADRLRVLRRTRLMLVKYGVETIDKIFLPEEEIIPDWENLKANNGWPDYMNKIDQSLEGTQSSRKFQRFKKYFTEPRSQSEAASNWVIWTVTLIAWLTLAIIGPQLT